MSKFVTGKKLEEAVYDILFQAKSQLLLVSPYIKLDNYFREILDRHARNPELELIVVFGKNEGNITRSVSRTDLDYFTKFPNVTLVYASSLHAKYYGNETKGIITSINLYDYSFLNNIEFGVYSENLPLTKRLLELVNGKSLKDQAFEQAMLVASSHDVIFAKRPVYKLRTGLVSKLVGGKDHMEPIVVVDVIEEILHNLPYERCRLASLPKEVEFGQTLSSARPSREEAEARRATSSASKPLVSVHTSPPIQKREAVSASPEHGYCIRTGAKIPYNTERPFCYSAYKVWAEFKNEDYPERYCHRTGEPTNGGNSKRSPILNTH